MTTGDRVAKLKQKGVCIPNPQSVDIGAEVSIDRISGDNVTLYAGTKIYGADTFIASGARLGYEGPVTVENCCIGRDTALNGGYFQEAVFLEGARCGLGSHVRKGTILEEQASIAHTVGLKQTILFPFVTLGSLINFCDCFMAGGTSRRNHSEVGSSYIHFNFTPHQDKATPSLMGDVPRGVMLNQAPIFLGGQGGMVGPCRVSYGTLAAAGTICRKDQLEENHLVIDSGPRSARLPLRSVGYRNLNRILVNNLTYIGNLYALRQWYARIRTLFVGERFTPEVMDALNAALAKGIDERIRRLGQLSGKIEAAGGKAGGVAGAFCANTDRIQEKLLALLEFEGHAPSRDTFVAAVRRGIAAQTGPDYLEVIQGLDMEQAAMGTRWLQGIVDHLNAEISPLIKVD